MFKKIVPASMAMLYGTTAAFSTKHAIEAVAGLMDGIIQVDHLTEMQQCI